ncbi:MAG: hypothetical protein HYX69_16190 [Planctomycetia bacterium]|nr:hypothetical protein [Planctomycetia bacterium]
MAKDESPKPKSSPGKKKSAPIPDNTVMLLLPKRLYDIADKMDPEVRKQLFRAIFGHDKLFGVSQVLYDKGTLKEGGEEGDYEPKKVCDGP